MVSWGTNTVHTFTPVASQTTPPSQPTAFQLGGSAPASTTTSGGSLFGAAPSSTPLFGAAPAAPSLGTTTTTGGSAGGWLGSPAPATGGLFGTTTTSAFGMPAPAPSLWGAPSSAPSAASTGGLWAISTSAAPSSSWLGGGGGTPAFSSPAAPPAWGGMGATPAPPPQIPSQAALQAHLDASARQEEARVATALTQVYRAYTGQATADSPKDTSSAPFTTLVYTDLTPEIRQWQWLQNTTLPGYVPHTASSTGGSSSSIRGSGPAVGYVRPVMLPCPPQVAPAEWQKALWSNPDCLSYMPRPLVGAEALLGRLTWQQEKAAQSARQLDSIRQTVTFLQNRCQTELIPALEELQSPHYGAARKRLLRVMRKVELARCFHQDLQRDELTAYRRWSQLYQQLEQLQTLLRSSGGNHSAPSRPAVLPDLTPAERQFWQPLLKEHRQGLTQMATTLQQDDHDLALIRDRVASVVPRAPVTAGTGR